MSSLPVEAEPPAARRASLRRECRGRAVLDVAMLVFGIAAAVACAPRSWEVPLNVEQLGGMSGLGGGGAGGRAAAGAAGAGGEASGGRMGRAGQGGRGFMGNGGAQATCPPIALKPQTPAILLLTDRSAKTSGPDDQGNAWSKGENEAITAAITSAPSFVKFGYRPFPYPPSNPQACGASDTWNGTWTGMVKDKIGACMSGSCVATSSDVPLASALDNVKSDEPAQGWDSMVKPWLVVLLGAPPSCDPKACTNAVTGLFNLSNRSSRMAEAIVPFGAAELDGGSCLDSLQAIASPVGPASTARTAVELKSNLTATIAGIVAHTQCTFVSNAFALYNDVESLRVQIGGPSGNTLPDLTNGGATKSWTDDGFSFEILGDPCKTIMEALSKGQTVSVSATLSSCNRNP